MKKLIFLLVTMSPLPFGSARPIWQWLWVILIALVAAISFLRNRRRSQVVDVPALGRIAVFWALFIAWLGGLVWLMPPTDILSGQWPGAFVPHFSTANGVAVICYFGAHMMLFLGAIAALESRIQANRILHTIAITAALYAAYGLVVHFTGSETILWFKKSSGLHSLTATFVNRNNFATYSGLGLLCVSAILIQRWRNLAKEGLHGKLLASHLIGSLSGSSWIAPLSFFILLTALILSGSRAGVASTLAAFVCLCLMAMPGRCRGLVTLALVPVLLLAFSLSGDFLLDRLEKGSSSDNTRYVAFALMLEVIAEHPISGFGVGRFAEVFAIFRTPDVLALLDRAHNDYLEIAFTAGVPSLVLLLAPVAILLQLFVRALAPAGANRPFVALGIAATVQVGLHSLVDFPLQIPAISYTYIIIVAMATMHALRALARPEPA